MAIFFSSASFCSFVTVVAYRGSYILRAVVVSVCHYKWLRYIWTTLAIAQKHRYLWHTLRMPFNWICRYALNDFCTFATIYAIHNSMNCPIHFYSLVRAAFVFQMPIQMQFKCNKTTVLFLPWLIYLSCVKRQFDLIFFFFDFSFSMNSVVRLLLVCIWCIGFGNAEHFHSSR